MSHVRGKGGGREESGRDHCAPFPPARLFAEMYAEIVPRRVRQADYSQERGLISTFGELATQSHRNMHHGNGSEKETEFANCPSRANWLISPLAKHFP